MKNDLGEQLRELREQNQITQEELGRFLGVTRITVLRWEHKHTNISKRMRRKLDSLLKIRRCPTCNKEL